nr:aspartate/glutamate racemase family protein [Sphaerochaetaceae bacterium]
ETPIISIDDAMCRKALEKGAKIAVLATAQSALEPAKWKLSLFAKEKEVDLTLESFCNGDAIAALKKGDRETHDKLILEMARKVSPDCDAIVLAQASMAKMRDRVEKESGIETLSSPELCYEEVKQFLDMYTF